MATLKYGSKCAFNLLVLYPFYHVGEVTGWGVPIHLLVRRSVLCPLPILICIVKPTLSSLLPG